MNSKHIWWLLTETYEKVVQKLTDIVGNIRLVSLIAWQNITWLNFHKIQNFIYIQICDRPNFKKPESKRTFVYTKGGFFKFGTCLADGGSGRVICWSFFCGRHKWVTSKTMIISKKKKCLESKRVLYSQNFNLIIRHNLTISPLSQMSRTTPLIWHLYLQS